MRIFLAIYFLVIVAVVSIFGFQGSTSKKTPIEIFPDMDRQARYKPQAENSFFADGRNDRPVPANTVARGNYFNQADVFSADFEDERLGDTVLLEGKNADGSFVQKLPLDVTNELMLEGQQKYDIYCGICHGASGDGKGTIQPFMEGALPASYHVDKLRDAEDGYLFDVISNGFSQMLGLKDRLTPEERWAIVLYVRALQLSQNASADALTDAQRSELGF